MIPVHPRSETVEKARTELMGLLIDLKKRHGLTECELAMIVLGQMSFNSQQWVNCERRRSETE